jgi:hypothetical protein
VLSNQKGKLLVAAGHLDQVEYASSSKQVAYETSSLASEAEGCGFEPRRTQILFPLERISARRFAITGPTVVFE